MQTPPCDVKLSVDELYNEVICCLSVALLIMYHIVNILKFNIQF